MDNRLEKLDFAEFVKDPKSIAGFSPSRQDSLKMAASEVASFETNFFRIAGTSEAETSASGKAECLLPTGEDEKVSFLD